MDIERNSSITEDFPKMSVRIVEQLMLLYKMNGEAWKDGQYKTQNPDDWPIFQGEAIRTILMLCRNFPDAKKLVLGNEEYRKVVSSTLERLLRSAENKNFDAAPYKDFDQIAGHNSSFVFIESLYTAGSVFLYALLVFGDEESIVEDKQIMSTQLQAIVNSLRTNYIKTQDKKTAAWGFCDLKFKPNFYDFDEAHHYELLYFTYNTINFMTLLKDANAGNLINEESFSQVTGEFFGEIRDWLETDFLKNPSIDMLNKPIEIEALGSKFDDEERYRIYNNLYVVNSLLLLGSTNDDLLDKAVKYTSQYVIDRFDSDFSFGDIGYPEYKFPLTGKLWDEADAKLKEDVLSYDDRSAHALVLMSLCLLAKRKQEQGRVDQELIDMIVTSYEELLKLRSGKQEFLALWDSISDPSVYYCVRAVDAITEFYGLALEFGNTIPVISSESVAESSSISEKDIRKVVQSEINLFVQKLLGSVAIGQNPTPTASVDNSEVEAIVEKLLEDKLEAKERDTDNDLGTIEGRLDKLEGEFKLALDEQRQKTRNSKLSQKKPK